MPPISARVTSAPPPKLQNTNTGDTLCSPVRKVTLDGVEYPNPCLSMAIYPKKKGEEDKVAQGVMRLCEEDPTIHFKNNQETHEMIISGMGEQHLDVVVSKLKSKFGVEVTLKKPKMLTARPFGKGFCPGAAQEADRRPRTVR